MLNKDINFVGAQTLKKINLIKYLKSGALGLLFLCGGILIAYLVTVVLLISLKVKVKKLDQVLKAKETQINTQTEIESLMFIVQSRSKVLKDIRFNGQKNASRLMDLISKLLDKGFQIRGEPKLGESGEFEAEGEAENAVTLAGIDRLMNELKTQGYFTEYRITSIQRKADGRYSLLIGITIGEAKI